MATFDIEFAELAASLPPAEAIAYMESKGYVITWSWQEQLTINNALVFTVAKVTKMEILKSVRAELERALRQGTTLAEFKKTLSHRLQAQGWLGKSVDGTKLAPYRMNTIFRSNVQSSLNAGRWKQFEDNANDRPYYQYVAVLDASTRPSHADLNGLILKHDSPRWNQIAPSNGYNCRCRLRALTKDQYEKKRMPQSSAQKAFKPDNGWATNPGKTQFKPKKTSYPSDIWDIASPVTID